MELIDYFVPGEQKGDEDTLSRLRRPIPAGVARSYAETYTQPGDIVALPYCQGAAAVREILSAGRRALALNFDPLLDLQLNAALRPQPARELDAAVARLGDSPKQGLPLRRYLEELYATTCPACLRPAVADYFIWDRERGAPVVKVLRCPACEWEGQTAADAEDRERLALTPARGMHYHYLLDRIAPQPQSGALRSRLERLLELYTPRNLYALAELTLKIESLFPKGPLQRALKTLLLDCLDHCSSLAAWPPRSDRRRGLRRPSRYPERNVWRAFAEAIARRQASAGKPVSGLADSLATFPASAEWSAFVGQGQVRDLVRALPPRSLPLILSSPPPLDSAAWSLAYLWGAWLLGAEAVTPLRPLFRQRTPDPAWYAQGMAPSLQALAALLRDDGRLVLVLSGQRSSLVEALLLAAAEARLGVTCLVQRGNDYRLELTPVPGQLVAAANDRLDLQIQELATETATATIRARGEPVAWRTLHAAILHRLAETGLLGSLLAEDDGPAPLDRIATQLEVGLTGGAFVRERDEGGEELWWLAVAEGLEPPLCDRVEAQAYQVLLGALALNEADFAARVYAHFAGVLTPAAELVAHCLRAYGRPATPGYWQLRPEDLPAARQAEQTAMIEHLLALGRRLGYRAEARPPFDAAWFAGEREQPRAAFVVRWTAALGEALALGAGAAGADLYLVLPGGRAALASYKLAHNPLWRQAVDESGWRFIKYRHLRRLAAQPEVDEYTLRAVVGLDPIVEREQAQLPLF